MKRRLENVEQNKLFLSSIVDLQTLQKKKQYNDILNISNFENDLSLQQFDEKIISSITITSNIMTSSSKKSFVFENDSIFISYERSYFESFKFELVLRL